MKVKYSIILLVFALILSACSTGPNPDQAPPTAVLGGGEQSPITLDSEFLEVAEREPGFAGMYYNDDGELIVAVAAPEGLSTQALELQRESVGAAIEAVFGEDVFYEQADEAQLGALADGTLSLQSMAAPERDLKLVRVPYSFKQLSDWRAQVDDLVWTVAGVSSLDTDEVANKVTVGVTDEAAAKRVQAELAALGLPADALEVDVVPSFSEETDLDRYNRPLVGGLGINRWGGSSTWSCTYGFNVVRYGVSGFLTNAHCTSVQGSVSGDRFYQGSASSIGRETAEAALWTAGSNRERWADVAFVRHENAPSTDLGGIAYTYLNQRNQVATTDISYKSYNPVAGESVYKVGVTTGKTYGRVTGTCVDVFASGTNIKNRCQTTLTSANSSDISKGGDSGSPYYHYSYVSGAGWKVELKGIHWGGSGDGSSSTAVFSPMRNIELALGGLRVHPYQKTGERLKVTLRYVRVHNDCEPWYKGDGDMYGYFDIEGSRVFTLSETDVASGESISINRYRTVDGRYDNPIAIRGVLKDADDTDADDWIGDWNLNLAPVPSVGYFSSYSRPDCDATLYYRIEDVGNLNE